jgi:uncharacterized membrane protein YeaQ/YmgE (transglycosylase-associated protein family)
MELLLWIAFGAALAVITRRLMPGPDPLGSVGAIVLGITGALLGGLTGLALTGTDLHSFDIRVSLASVTGGMIALFCYRAFALRGNASFEAPRGINSTVRHAGRAIELLAAPGERAQPGSHL